jgi:hypothetical protein
MDRSTISGNAVFSVRSPAGNVWSILASFCREIAKLLMQR